MRFQASSALLITALTLSLTPASAHAKATVPLGHVEVRGSGPTPIVLVSGPTLDWRYWEGFMDRNAERYTMYAVTLPGMSGTAAMPMPAPWRPADRAARQDPPMGTPWLDNAVEAVADMMIERCPGPAVVMGHAMGGTLALRLGIEHPKLVSAVVSLEGPVAYPVSREVSKKERTVQALTSFAVNMGVITPEQWPEQMRQWTLTAATDPEIVDYVTTMSLETDREVVIRYMVEHYMTDLTNEIGELRAPTLAIFTEITAENIRSVNAVKKRQFGPAWHEDIRFYETDDISYFYNLKQPERFDTEIGDFLRAQDIASRGEPGEGDR
jgi:pimeloyl-ACP methyl ester carboxylesterase